MAADTSPPTDEIAVGPLRAAVARPSPERFGPGPYPGVLVLHELVGLNDDMRRITRRFADNGYVALAPDLMSHGNRASCLTRVLVDVFVRGCRGQTLDDVMTARDALAARPDVDSSRVAVAGFCMGGSFALVLATKAPLAAAAVNYGAVPKERDELDGVCPVVASYGLTDKVFAPQGRRLEQHLQALGVPHDVRLYEGVGHSFLSDDNIPGWMAKLPSPLNAGYSEPEAEDAWSRILAFFTTHV